jgi:preprotein translocase subunit SecA
VVVHGLDDQERHEAYGSDITYVTNNELGFDYLRDNMKLSLEHCVQRELAFAIVDEVDSILIDEARTPLIISGRSEQNVNLYGVVNKVIPRLQVGTKGEASKEIEETGDYWVDEKAHSATLTEAGVHKVEKMLGVENLYDPQMVPVIHAVNQALSAYTLKKVDVDYVVKVGETGKKEVIIVDEFTGRLMPGRRWSDGLHQAVEAKEGITIQSENQTLASVTFQDFFRMYDKVGGMTGTADTEAPEFANIYNLDVTVAPTNKPMIRDDLQDVVFKTGREKFDAVIEEIIKRNEAGQPILVGTISIDTSEKLSKKLAKRGVKHNVLNAKQHEREAEIVAQAGRFGSVTISTNMAGRGTDIVLGGNAEFLALIECNHDKEHPEYAETLATYEDQCMEERGQVLVAGGLHIMGTERHESRRIDNQLRGRSGRQGDPGSTQFFLSLEDDLLRIFESERVAKWWDRVGVEDGEAIENTLLTKVIENAQTKVEARNFDMRKHLLDYDDVMNKQRRAFYSRRRELLGNESIHQEVIDMAEGALVANLDAHWPEKGSPEAAEMAELAAAIEAQFGIALDPTDEPFVTNGTLVSDRDALGLAIFDRLSGLLEEKRKVCDAMAVEHSDIRYPHFVDLERDILLQILDARWKDHLHTMDGLRDGVGLRGYASRDPKLEYQREGYALFEEMNQHVDSQAVDVLYKFTLPDPQPRAQAMPGQASQPPEAMPPPARGGSRPRTAGPTKRGKIGRNDPCHCGSGRKFKKCCGAL